jgi:hypothetical protein
LSDLARRFIERRLFKAIDLEMRDAERAEFIRKARSRVAAQGFDPDYYLIEDRAADIPYYSYYRPEGKARLLIQHNGATGSGELSDIADVSGVVRGMRGYELHRLCFPIEVIEAVEGVRQG